MEEKFNFPILMQNKNIGQLMKKLIFRMEIGYDLIKLWQFKIWEIVTSETYGKKLTVKHRRRFFRFRYAVREESL